ncbi:MAG: hypothetical protein HC845_00650 [Akkermansiaceae bacterium]|nr:hypothetical protein [Akkermansiaceae bacterium]
MLAGIQPYTVTTDSNGIYNFTNLLPGSYLVKIGTANFASGGALVNKPASSGNTGTADNQQNDDDNGIQSASGAEVSSPVIALTGTELDSTVDFGFFTPLSLGNLVFMDSNNNGLFDSGTDMGIDGVSVQLLFDANNNGTIDAAELTTPFATTSTSGGGVYSFSNLVAGNYQVVIPVSNFSVGSALATKNVSSSNTDTADNGQDDDDNGTQAAPSAVTTSPLIALLGGTEPGSTGSANTDNTIDFGFIAPSSIGSLVFMDSNNNGLFDSGTEMGIGGVTVQLFLDVNGDNDLNDPGEDVAVATTATSTVSATLGQYNFANLVPGNYQVVIPVTNFATGAPLVAKNTSSSPGVTDTADNNQDNDDNGTQVSSGLVTTSPFINLAAGESDQTIDLGFFQTVALGNFVFLDSNNDGLLTSENGLSGATVQLFNSDGTTPATNYLGVAVPSQTTGGSGQYSFPDLAPGDYIVRATPPAGFIPATPASQPDPDLNPADNDSNGVQVPSQPYVQSPVVTLLAGTEPINDDDELANTNTTVDFGFVPSVGVGNLVFNDAMVMASLTRVKQASMVWLLDYLNKEMIHSLRHL